MPEYVADTGEPMKEVLSLNVRITPKDLKEFSFAKYRSGILIIRFIYLLCIVITVILSAGMAIAVLMFEDTETKSFTVTAFSIMLVIAWMLYLIPPFSQYMRLLASHRKSSLLRVLQHYRIYGDRLESYSKDEKVALYWKDIYYVQELRPCFAIYPAPGMVVLIPRRCFESQDQLDLFISVLESEVSRKKVRLKKYRLRHSNPDRYENGMTEGSRDTEGCRDIAGAETRETGAFREAGADMGHALNGAENAQGTAGDENAHGSAGTENTPEQPVLETEFSIGRDEYIRMRYRLYYTRPQGLVLTAVGVLLAALSSMGFILGTGKPWLALVPALVLLLYPALALYFAGRKHFNMNMALQKPRTMKFYPDRFVVLHPSGVASIRYCDLVKIREEKAAFLLFVTDHLVHIIPKRVFDGREDDAKVLRDLLRSTGLLKQ